MANHGFVIAKQEVASTFPKVLEEIVAKRLKGLATISKDKASFLVILDQQRSPVFFWLKDSNTIEYRWPFDMIMCWALQQITIDLSVHYNAEILDEGVGIITKGSTDQTSSFLQWCDSLTKERSWLTRFLHRRICKMSVPKRLRCLL